MTGRYEATLLYFRQECPCNRVPEHGSCQEDVPANAGFACDKTAALKDTTKGTPCIMLLPRCRSCEKFNKCITV